MDHPLPDQEWQALRVALRERCARLGDKAWVDDAIQAAVAALLAVGRSGRPPLDPIGWCMVFIRRRAVDRQRRAMREVQGIDLDALVQSAAGKASWVAKLRDAGVVLSPQAEDLVERLESGFRGNRRLAAALGRDVRSVREMRWRLQRTLRHLYEEIHGDPPPVRRPCGCRGPTFTVLCARGLARSSSLTKELPSDIQRTSDVILLSLATLARAFGGDLGTAVPEHCDQQCCIEQVAGS